MIANKRVRIDESVASPAGQPKLTKAPLSITLTFLTAHIASLHPDIAAILKERGKIHLHTQAKINHKIIQANKMKDNPDFYPRSARFEFKLNLMEATKAREGYNTLTEEVESSLKDMKEKFKTYVIRTINLEIATLKDELITTFVKDIRHIVKTFTAAHDSLASNDMIVLTIMEAHHETILQHMNCTFEQFKSRYLSTHSLSSWPQPHTDNAAVPPSTQERQMGAFARAVINNRALSQQAEPEPTTNNVATPISSNTSRVAESIKRALESVYVTTWEKYTTQVKSNEISLKIKKIATNYDHQESSEATAMNIDTETSVPPELIEELISKKTREATKKLHGEMTKLSNQVSQLLDLQKKNNKPNKTKTAKGEFKSSKNTQRGNHASASQEKQVRQRSSSKQPGRGSKERSQQSAGRTRRPRSPVNHRNSTGGGRGNASPRRRSRQRPQSGTRQQGRN